MNKIFWLQSDQWDGIIQSRVQCNCIIWKSME